LFRRDHMLLAGPGFAGESWRNQVHDVVSGIAYGAMVAAPLALARRWHDDPDWAHLSRPVQALTLASAAALAVFASRRTSALMFRRVAGRPVLPRMDQHKQVGLPGTPVAGSVADTYDGRGDKISPGSIEPPDR
jgi:Protein of unknown function (DUF998)